MDWHTTLHDRAEALRRRIEAGRERAPWDKELTHIEGQYADLHNELRDLRARPHAPDPAVIDRLHARLGYVDEQVAIWIERQDNGAARG